MSSLWLVSKSMAFMASNALLIFDVHVCGMDRWNEEREGEGKIGLRRLVHMQQAFAQLW